MIIGLTGLAVSFVALATMAAESASEQVGGFRAVYAGASPTKILAFVFNGDRYLALCVFAYRGTMQFEITEYELDVCCTLQRLECGGNRAVATR